ncbi:MAG: hypothetical protein EHM85_01545 [Desulfobacteraceae bacterium]|nr:MAG: hypothetical protein EHM85_01545 [Desulfobacteraceae bacterium]
MNRVVYLRRLTDSGIEAFRVYLAKLRSGSQDQPPYHLLEEDRYAVPAYEGIAVEQKLFSSRLEFAKYANSIFSKVVPDDLFNDTGVWSWLSLYYFEQVCPLRSDGLRSPGRDYRHIPDQGFRIRHRHLLSGAYLVYTIYCLRELLAGFLLYSDLQTESQIYHQIVSRQNLVTNPVVVEAAGLLYFNKKTKRPKKGAFQTNKAGTLNRFVMVMQQLDLNYDLYSMESFELLDLLPPEFDRWKN